MLDKTNFPAGRVCLFDELRGLSILLMLLYHGAFDLIAVYGVTLPLFELPILQSFLQPLFAALFVLISGAVSNFSRNNLRRGFAALGCGLILTFATSLLMPAIPDRFGILHLLGCSILLYALVRPGLTRISPAVGFLSFSALFLLTWNVQNGALGFPPFSISLPTAWYSTPYLFPLGLPAPAFTSADYFPLLPWGLLFFAGTFLGVWAKAGKLPAYFYKPHLPVLAVIGHHTLWIYLFHQPVLIGLIALFFWLTTGSVYPV